ncbi:MAG: hypothetical protein Unbinned4336contig1001_16 [Prokaryotic dsDNA virus sp.]|nr:MAG: hypothetical protein Unbinned4336contig1001_16 [Prokaryotic dsDNA virus sp.]|tara:strand:+ start:203 stop:493 length:291 start_codon:yes stop_codon:yes gene_type:complete
MVAQASEAAVRAWNEAKAKEGKASRTKKTTEKKTTRKYFKGANGYMWMEVEIEDGSPMMKSTFLFNAPPKARSYKKVFKNKTMSRDQIKEMRKKAA